MSHHSPPPVTPLRERCGGIIFARGFMLTLRNGTVFTAAIGLVTGLLVSSAVTSTGVLPVWITMPLLLLLAGVFGPIALAIIAFWLLPAVALGGVPGGSIRTPSADLADLEL